MTFEEFQAQAPDLARQFERVCLADDKQLVNLGVIQAPRRSLHVASLWSYEQRDNDVWIATGSWGEEWRYDNLCWYCDKEFPWVAPSI